jgi:hypothetical protein
MMPDDVVDVVVRHCTTRQWSQPMAARVPTNEYSMYFDEVLKVETETLVEAVRKYESIE